PIRWVRMAPWDDPARLLAARPDVDVLLGWPAMTLDDLRRRGLIASPDAGAGPQWVTVAIGSDRTGSPSDASGVAGRPLSIGDPRIDPASRCEVALALARGDWRDGYARVIEEAAWSSTGLWPPDDACLAGAAL